MSLVCAIMAFVFVIIPLFENSIVRTILGMPIVLFIPGQKSNVDRILSIILIFSIIFAIGMLYYVITSPKIGERFTEFYILGSSGKADNYSTQLKVGSSTTLLTGVVNHEYSTVNYTVQIVLNNDTLSSRRLTLSNNEIWEKNITFVPIKAGNDMKLELLLFKENNFTSPYRELYLWVNMTI